MAIGYTPQTWVNGSAPALSAANLQTMDNGINAACDALDAMAVDGTGIPDATTAIKGRVALATTGVEEATKVPKATGADLAALLTAGGYTLTAPSGANSLDGIADTATWKKVAAAVATALNAGTYHPEYLGSLSGAVNFDEKLTQGQYMLVNVSGGTSDSGVAYGFFFVETGNAGTFANDFWIRQTVIQNNGGVIKKRKKDGVNAWSAWTTDYDCLNDGNGGQPPAPKPRSATGAGNFTRAVWTGSETKIPDGGQWVVFNYDSAIELWNEPSFYAGGTTLTSNNIPNKYLCWRLTE